MKKNITKVLNEKVTPLTITHESGKVEQVDFVQAPSRNYERNLEQAVNAYFLMSSVDMVAEGETFIRKVQYTMTEEEFIKQATLTVLEGDK